MSGNSNFADLAGTAHRENVVPRVTTEFGEGLDGDVFECLEGAAAPSAEPQETFCELHTYDSRLNAKGEPLYLFSGWKRDGVPKKAKHSRDGKAAMVLVRTFYPNGELKSSSLEIHSPHIKKALKEVVKTYPGISLNGTNHIIMGDDLHCLFHYRKELQAYANSLAATAPEAKEHVLFCLRYAYKTLHKQCLAYKSTMLGTVTRPGLEWDKLWMAFRPGDYIYSKRDGDEKAYRLLTIAGGYGWSLHLEGIAYNGREFGHVRHFAYIGHYDGYKALTDLAYFPLRYHPQLDRVKRDLISRGKQYVSFSGSHHRLYQGVADFLERGKEKKPLESGESDDDEPDMQVVEESEQVR